MLHESAAAARRPETPRERRRRETGREIGETAARLLASEGLEALTMARLAAELGYTAGALYRYYPSKDALLAELLEAVAEALAQDLLEVHGRAVASAARADLEPAAAALLPLLAAAGSLASLADRDPQGFALLAAALADPAPGAAAALAPALVKPFDQLVRCLEGAAAAGALARGPAARRAVCLWSALHGLRTAAPLRRLGGRGCQPARLRAATLRALLVGWGADAERVAGTQARAARLLRRRGRRAD